MARLVFTWGELTEWVNDETRNETQLRHAAYRLRLSIVGSKERLIDRLNELIFEQPPDEEASYNPTAAPATASAPPGLAKDVVCPRCGIVNSGNTKFCAECGLALEPPTAPAFVPRGLREHPQESLRDRQQPSLTERYRETYEELRQREQVVCPNCRHQNPAEARFCLECGYTLVVNRTQRAIQNIRQRGEADRTRRPDEPVDRPGEDTWENIKRVFKKLW